MTVQRSAHKLRVKTVEIRPDAVVLIDQLALPHDERYVTCATWREVAVRISDMTVRGAPAIGVTAAGGLHLAAAAAAAAHDDREPFVRELEVAAAGLAATRPTAVNLTWAIAEMRRLWTGSTGTTREIARQLYERAVEIHDDDIERCLRIGEHGAGLFGPGDSILTHCNAGALATAGYGTALGVVRAAHARHADISVFVDETRPWLQGARLTAWELTVEEIPFTLITDNMAGHFIATGAVDAVVVGADRIAANGDAANKIGTYTLSVLAKEHAIPIEERDESEVTRFAGAQVAPVGTRARHPAFDVTPAANITAIITETGALRPPFDAALAAALEDPS